MTEHYEEHTVLYCKKHNQLFTDNCTTCMCEQCEPIGGNPKSYTNPQSLPDGYYWYQSDAKENNGEWQPVIVHYTGYYTEVGFIGHLKTYPLDAFKGTFEELKQ